jgi:hypothetical protein
MAHKQQNVTNILRRSMSKHDLLSIWTEDYSTIFEPNLKNLLKTHRVPKFKRHFADHW